MESIKNARNLGVTFDSSLCFHNHISNMCRSSFLCIRQLRQIRSSLDFDTAIIVANSIVHSKLDYCNALFAGLPLESITRLQRVQNSLARVVCKSCKFKYSSSFLLQRLHWLPIHQRIVHVYKIATMTFKALHFSQPSYLTSMLSSYHPCRSLRSSFSSLLVIPDVRSEIGRRSFFYRAPQVWNNLPLSLRLSKSLCSFCSKLKTHLFPP